MSSLVHNILAFSVWMSYEVLSNPFPHAMPPSSPPFDRDIVILFYCGVLLVHKRGREGATPIFYTGSHARCCVAASLGIGALWRSYPVRGKRPRRQTKAASVDDDSIQCSVFTCLGARHKLRQSNFLHFGLSRCPHLALINTSGSQDPGNIIHICPAPVWTSFMDSPFVDDLINCSHFYCLFHSVTPHAVPPKIDYR